MAIVKGQQSRLILDVPSKNPSRATPIYRGIEGPDPNQDSDPLYERGFPLCKLDVTGSLNCHCHIE